jgi:hypothetical protein
LVVFFCGNSNQKHFGLRITGCIWIYSHNVFL